MPQQERHCSELILTAMIVSMLSVFFVLRIRCASSRLMPSWLVTLERERPPPDEASATASGLCRAFLAACFPAAAIALPNILMLLVTSSAIARGADCG